MRWAIALLALLLVVPVHALTYTAVDREALPLLNVYDPVEHTNEDITTYSYEQLDAWFDDPRFRAWNDLPRLCQSMQIMFGRASSRCSGMTLPPLTPRTSRAYSPPPEIEQRVFLLPQQPVIIMTDPFTPPWSTAGQWYGPYGPYPPRPYRIYW